MAAAENAAITTRMSPPPCPACPLGPHLVPAELAEPCAAAAVQQHLRAARAQPHQLTQQLVVALALAAGVARLADEALHQALLLGRSRVDGQLTPAEAAAAGQGGRGAQGEQHGAGQLAASYTRLMTTFTMAEHCRRVLYPCKQCTAAAAAGPSLLLCCTWAAASAPARSIAVPT
jgi:hypothetical protein